MSGLTYFHQWLGSKKRLRHYLNPPTSPSNLPTPPFFSRVSFERLPALNCEIEFSLRPYDPGWQLPFPAQRFGFPPFQFLFPKKSIVCSISTSLFPILPSFFWLSLW